MPMKQHVVPNLPNVNTRISPTLFFVKLSVVTLPFFPAGRVMSPFYFAGFLSTTQYLLHHWRFPSISSVSNQPTTHHADRTLKG